MNTEKMKEVFSEEAFVKSLSEMESVAEMQEALNSKGVQLTQEEVTGLRDFFQNVKSGEISREQLEGWSKLAENGELAEDVLEQIAGGSFLLVGFAAILAVHIPSFDDGYLFAVVPSEVELLDAYTVLPSKAHDFDGL